MLKRRGLLGGAAALAAAVVGKLGTADRAEATHGGAANDVILGAYNERGNSEPTVIGNSDLDAPAISGSNGFYPGQPGATFVVAADGVQGITNKTGGVGVRGSAPDYGVAGQVVRGGAPASNNAVGVLGQTSSGAAVRGEITGGSGQTGSGVVGVAGGCVFGNASSVGIGGSGRGSGKTGVLGITDFGLGVQGWAQSGGVGIRGSSNAGGGPDFGGSGIGVDGRSGSGYGVYAVCQSGPGIFGGSNTTYGVYGNSNNTTGVYGTGGQKGVWGRTTAVGSIGVFGQATAANSFGVYGVAPPPGWAGYFEGNAYVSGVVVQGGPDGSSTSRSDGSSAASIPPLVEVVGEAKLVGGRAEVTLDASFGAVADAGAYHVFLTEGGDYGGLYVPRKTATGFEVRARGAGASGTFSYRVIAKRRAGAEARVNEAARPSGIAAKDMEPLTLPAVPTPADSIEAAPSAPGPLPEPQKPTRRESR